MGQTILEQPAAFKRPESRALPRWKQFELRTSGFGESLQVVSIRDPEGRHFSLSKGETVEMIANGSGRDVFVRTPDGERVSFDSWKATHIARGIETLKKANPMYAELFAVLLEKFPELEQLEIIAGTKETNSTLQFSGGYWKAPQEEGQPPGIVVVMSVEQHYEALLVDREPSARDVAVRLGMSFDALKKQPALLALFIFAHEIGHVHDFITHYLSDPKNAKTMVAVEQQKLKRKAEMDTLPVRGHSPAKAREMFVTGDLQRHFEKYKTEYAAQFGIHSVDELLVQHELAYRAIPTEKYADDFATNMLKAYLQVYNRRN